MLQAAVDGEAGGAYLLHWRCWGKKVIAQFISSHSLFLALQNFDKLFQGVMIH